MKKPDIAASIITALPIANRHPCLRSCNAARRKIASVEFDKEKAARKLTLINPEKAF
jgi:hypothetical protein